MTYYATLSGTDTVECEGITIKRRNGPCGAMARALLEAGFDPNSMIEFYRGSTQCFTPTSLSKWADLTTSETKSATVKMIKYVPLPEGAFQ